MKYVEPPTKRKPKPLPPIREKRKRAVIPHIMGLILFAFTFVICVMMVSILLPVR